MLPANAARFFMIAISLVQELGEFAEVLPCEGTKSANSGGPQSAVVFSALAKHALYRSIAFPTNSHLDNNLRQVGRRHAPLAKPAQACLIVARNPVARVIGAVSLEDLPSHEERRVWGHPSACELAPRVGSGSPAADYLFRILRRDIVEITINSRGVGLRESLRHASKDIVLSEEIITVYQPDDVPGGCSDAFVQGIVNPFVWLADDVHVRMSFIFDFRERVIRRRSINHNMLDIRVALRRDALDGLSNGCSAIIYSRDDSDLQLKRPVLGWKSVP